MNEIYLDNGATTKVAPEVAKEMSKTLTNSYGNASAIYSLGLKAKESLENSREIIAKTINASPEEIIFTSSGTESNNFALKGVAFANKDKGNHIITTKIEHKCILESCKWLENQGFKITYLDVDKDGFISLNDLEKSITPKTILISVIHGQNEIGTIQDLEKIGKICKKHNVYFHSDACQSYTKTKIDVKKQNLSLVTLNSHKIHGPKGVAALYIKKGTNIDKWQHGGGQESNLRAGTENISGIVGFAKAAEIAQKESYTNQMIKLRDNLINGILKIPGTRLNGPKGEKRLCNNINISFRGIEGEALSGYLDQYKICSSTGSACSIKTLEPSYILTAIGLSHEEANGSLRLTLSRYNTEAEINYLIKVLPQVVEKLRAMSPCGKEVI